MDRILIIEDSRDVNLLLAEALSDAGYDVRSSYDGLNGLREIRSSQFDLILLDIMLPYKSGDEVLKEIRKTSDIPVIIISAKDMIGIKIDLLRLGADDYITKPFDLGEVAARVETNLRRARRLNDQESLHFKNLTLEKSNKRVTVNQVEIELAAKEYEILELLLSNQGKVFSKSNLYETIWDEEYLGNDNAVKTHVSNLRNKLKKESPEEEYIETVWGLGYRLCKS